jgi:enoyl-CoA hydratase/carnithine racemase
VADETIIYEKKEGIATLTFNRPEVMNAGNFQMMEESRRAIADAGADDDVRVLILTGAGRAFHAGDDVKQVFLSGDREKRRAAGRAARIRGTGGASSLPQIFKPTIAAVNGAAVGYGMDIALSCDIRIATENAKFGYFYVRRGLMGTEIGPLMLVHSIGLSRALEMMLSGELIDAAEADRIGLVSRIVPADKLLEEANALAHKLMQSAPLAQQAVKRSVYKALYDPSEIADFTGNLLSLLFETEDHLEGARAFTEKREPEYKGR